MRSPLMKGWGIPGYSDGFGKDDQLAVGSQVLDTTDHLAEHEEKQESLRKKVLNRTYSGYTSVNDDHGT